MIGILLLGCAGGVDPDPLTMTASPIEGPLPLSVTFTAAGHGAAEAAWDFGDGHSASGAEVTHTYLGTGGFFATLTSPGDPEVSDQQDITVGSQECPLKDTDWESGTISDERINEASGLVASHMNPGVLWTHNDSGDDPRFYAIDESGNLLAVVDLLDVYRGDWEDMALGRNPETDAWQLIAGNVGDNSHERDDVHIHFIDEPVVAVGQALVELEIPALTIHVTYPDGEMLDCESLMVDPVTQDLYLVSKDYDGRAGVYRKSPPHEWESTTELELIHELDFSVAPLSGSATTGADWSPLGDLAVIRTYGITAYLWRRDQSEPVEAMWEDPDPCSVRLPGEQQSESIAFATDASGLWSLSEGDLRPLNFIAFEE